MKTTVYSLLFLVISISSSAQLLADFETVATTPTLSGQDGGATSVINNPSLTGNTSAKVGRYQKPAGNWKAIYLNFATKKNVSVSDRLTFKLRSSSQGRVFVKVVNGSTTILEGWAPDFNFRPIPFTWTECVLDISSISNQEFDRIEVNAGVDNDAAAEVLVDDFKLVNSLSPNGEPIANVQVSASTITLGETIFFDASGSIDLDGEVVSYLWNFGNGNTATIPLVEYEFPTEGIKNVTLRVTDNEGKSALWQGTFYVLPSSGKIGLLTFNQPVNQYEKAEGVFLVNGNYSNVYDPDIIKIDALITHPDASISRVPCFYFQNATYNASTDRWTKKTSNDGYWMVRFISSQSGIHTVKLELTDAGGTITSQVTSVQIGSSAVRGIIKSDPANKQYYRHTTGQPFYPLGINVGWNSTTNYAATITNLGNGGANVVRYWQAPFDRQGLEWKNGNGFYQGLGVYSQEAAAEQDSIILLGEKNNVYLQLVLFHHGMFSETVDSNWSDNPYNALNGGPLTQSEQYFYNAEAKQRTKKLLRYIVARWGYSRNLFAWELFNEVNFTGSHPNQSAQWLPAVKAWHDEMGQYIKSLDAFKHLITTSSDESHLIDMDKLQGLDNVQYHLYNPNLLSVQIAKDKDLLSKLTRTGVINGEYGLNVTTADVPFDTQRISIWTGIMTQVPHFMWKWENYTNPTWSLLFKFPATYLANEDIAAQGALSNWNFSAKQGSTSLGAVGFYSPQNFYGIVYDPTDRNNITGVSCDFSALPPAYYNVALHNTLTGAVSQQELPFYPGSTTYQLPVFSKAVALKVKYASALTTPFAFAGENRVGGVGQSIALSGAGSYNPFTQPLTYQWTLVEKPAESVILLAATSGVSTSFVPDVLGDYVISLVVSVNGQFSEPYKVTVSINTVTGIEDRWIEQITMYPNPTKGAIQFNIPERELNEIEVTLHDTAGRELKATIIRNDGSGAYMELGTLANGVYLIRFSTGSATFVKKLVYDSR